MKPEFITWNKPLLASAADYILRQPDSTKNNRIDLRNMTLVVSGSRARNRLEEILLDKVQEFSEKNRLKADWYPPEFILFGALPERFYAMKKPVANDLTQKFAWIAAIKKMSNDEMLSPQLMSLLPHLPPPDDLDANLTLGGIFAQLHKELASEDLNFATVAEKLRNNPNVPESEIIRWNVLKQLQKIYADEILAGAETWDIQLAREFAIKNQTDESQAERADILKKLKDENRHFYLIGLTDMNKLQRDILEPFGELIAPVVFAPESFADRFDEFGCLKTDKWENETIDIDEPQIEIVSNYHAQADAVLNKIAGFNGKYAANEIIIAVPDENAAPFIEQKLGEAKQNTRFVAGTPIRQNAVYRLLETLAAFLNSQTFKAFATLVRHPDVERFVSNKLAGTKTTGLITELDQYYAAFLPQQFDGNCKEIKNEKYGKQNQTFEAVKAAWKVVDELVSLNDAEKILKQIYHNTKLPATKSALEQIQSAIDAIQEIPAIFRLAPFSFAEQIKLILAQIDTGKVVSESDSGAIEMLGWLEIPMDDAAAVIVTGLNEGVVPSFTTSDIFLPDEVRKQLGINDNKRRYVRDFYALKTILTTREKDNVHLITCKQTDSSALPSRLLFATPDNEKIARFVRRFFDDKHKDKEYKLNGGKTKSTQTGSLSPIPNVQPEKRIEKISVTDFAQYKRCPYLYYLLQRQLNLQALNDDAEELNAMDFGTLVHHVVEKFGQSENIKDSTKPRDIFDFLESELNELINEKYGTPRATIAIQAEMAKARLEVFAQQQALWRKNGLGKGGYRIEEVEFSKETKLNVDNDRVLLKGKIDRIDVNENDSNDVVVFDYKTGKDGPEKKHRKRKGDDMEWIDFQLPLYHYILRQNGYADKKIRLGYFMIPADTGNIKTDIVDWEIREIDNAIDEARDIVRKIWNNEFPRLTNDEEIQMWLSEFEMANKW